MLPIEYPPEPAGIRLVLTVSQARITLYTAADAFACQESGRSVEKRRPFLSRTSFPGKGINRSFWNVAIIFLLVGLIAKGSLAAALQESSTTAERQTVEHESAPTVDVVGSKLLAPASFGLDIDIANVVPCDWKNVITKVGEQSVVCRVHVRVGENFVVLLPDGQLVSRLAKEVERTDKEFQPEKSTTIAQNLLNGELARFKGMKVKRTKHYVFLYNTSGNFADATSRILESMIGGVEDFVEKQGIETHDPDVPLVVIMFSSDREFQAYRAMPRGILAYYNMVNNRVVLHEESIFANTRPDLVRGQLLSTIAHEGAHQILHNIGVQQRLSLWPMWLSEGLAEFLAPTSFGRFNRWKGAGVVNDLRMFELETYLQSQFIIGFNGDTITKNVTAGTLDSTGYAAAWAIVHYLANNHKEGFNELVCRMSHLGPMRGMAARPGDPVIENLEHFNELFGEVTPEMETDMVKYLSKLDYLSPVAELPHYVGMAVIPVDGQLRKLACFFHAQEQIEQWKNNLKDSFSQEQLQASEWRVEEFKNRETANQAIRRFLK